MKNHIIQFKVSDLTASDESSVSEKLDNALFDNQVYINEKPVIDLKKLKDIGLIQCFWGNDAKRILATTKSLMKLLNDQTRPEHWAFVEAQTDRSKTCFGWLSSYGVKYKFKKIEDDSKDVFLKMPLWNIGANLVNDGKLCFIDSDIWFENGTWLDSVSAALDEYDVISPAGFIRSPDGALSETIGRQIRDNGFNFRRSECGLAVAMTRTAYDKYGGFDAVNYLDDQWFWFTVVGESGNSSDMFVLPYEPRPGCYHGYPFNVGSTDEVCVHEQHSQYRPSEIYRLAQRISYGKCMFGEDLLYDKTKSDLPIWRSTSIAKTVRSCFSKLFAGDICEDMFITAAKELFGKIDKQHPLVFVTSYQPDFKHKDSVCVNALNEKLHDMCRTPFTFVCVSHEKIDGIDTVPFDYSGEFDLDTMLKSGKVVFPKHSTIIYVDIDTTITEPFEVYRNQRKLYIFDA